MKEAIKKLEKYRDELKNEMDLALKRDKQLSYLRCKDELIGIESAIEILTPNH